jgi:hypothetical protein
VKIRLELVLSGCILCMDVCVFGLAVTRIDFGRIEFDRIDFG